MIFMSHILDPYVRFCERAYAGQIILYHPTRLSLFISIFVVGHARLAQDAL